ncbi:hypothetical protein T12_8671 [Trichinella patagoniensis]|uniref:Uncharacterized protein n=1 Tax=Trichinella patagoniensis TaxID=990121 RepID=A0A0V0ZJ89_9BILA|nr:hypothetical protein T12_8671 [Trichinella patagoniensis]
MYEWLRAEILIITATLWIIISAFCYVFCMFIRKPNVKTLLNESTANFNNEKKRVLFIVTDLCDVIKYFGPLFTNFTKADHHEVYILCLQSCSGKKYLWYKFCLETFVNLTTIAEANVTFSWNQSDLLRQLLCETFININIFYRSIYFFEPLYGETHVAILTEMCLIHILQRNIDMVFTYDTDGADENFLQPAIYDSLTVLVKKSMLPENVAVYSLTNSIGIRSILGLYDVPFASFFGYDLISQPMDILILQKLYLLLSTEHPVKSFCQMIFNTCFLYNSITKMNMETASKTHD